MKICHKFWYLGRLKNVYKINKITYDNTVGFTRKAKDGSFICI